MVFGTDAFLEWQVGDPIQLPATVLSDRAKEHGCVLHRAYAPWLRVGPWWIYPDQARSCHRAYYSSYHTVW